MKKIKIIYFSILSIITIGLMIYDYNKYPYNPDSDHLGNQENVLYYYPLIVLAELFLVFLTLSLFEKGKRLLIKLLIIIVWISIAAAAFITSIHGGGVIAAHALWLAVISVSITLILVLRHFKR